MKMFKSFVLVALIAVTGIAQAGFIPKAHISSSSSSKKKEENKTDSMPKLGQACMVEINNGTSPLYYNVNVIRYVEVDVNKPHLVNISYLGNNRQDTTFTINYGSAGDAAKKIKELVKKINQCK